MRPSAVILVAATITAVHLMKSLPYDPIKDFTPIIAAVEPVTCLAVAGAVVYTFQTSDRNHTQVVAPK